MAYLNGDDILLPGCLAYVANAFQRHPEIDFVYGHRVVIDSDGDEVGRWVLPPHDAKAIKWADFIPQETMFWRRRVWEKLGGFDASFRFALDWDFILRAHEAGFRFLRLPRFLGCFRVHPEQKTVKDSSIGLAESRKLRLTHLGIDPPPGDIAAALHSYRRRQAFFHRLYKIPIIRY
jgi:GT2 family glycosyltransferase